MINSKQKFPSNLKVSKIKTKISNDEEDIRFEIILYNWNN